jgi:hypothetical protein
MSHRLLIHAERLTPRVRYIFGLLLGERLGLELTFTDHPDIFTAHQGPRLSYGSRPLDGLHFHAHGLLSEHGHRALVPDVTVLDDGSVQLFSGPSDGALPFDPFAAAFFLVSRYEEYGDVHLDPLGRYDATQSLAVRNGFLSTPVVDHWVLLLRDVLLLHYPQLDVRMPSFRFTSTIDVDNAFAYRHKGALRNLGAALRALARGEGPWQRLSVLAGRTPDPYDTYDLLRALHQRTGAAAHVFFLLADRGKFDTNLPHTDPALRGVVHSVAQWATVGIHPGYRSNREPHLVALERSRLEQLLGREVATARQHFIMLRFPDTYRQLIAAGITHDYSMGYPTHCGFRAGTSDAFLFYDLVAEEVTGLRVHPFCCMDVTLRSYGGLSPRQAMAEVSGLVAEVRRVGGHFMPLWHNESLSDQAPWQGWREVFEHVLREGTGVSVDATE